MSDAAPLAGGCFCGAVRFEVTPPTLLCCHCHCSMCRRLHGAAYATWLIVPREGFRLLAGDADLVRYSSSKVGTRSFCRVCGSSLLCEIADRDHVDVAVASLDGPPDQAPAMHVFYSDHADWASVDEKLPRRGGATGMEPIEG